MRSTIQWDHLKRSFFKTNIFNCILVKLSFTSLSVISLEDVQATNGLSQSLDFDDDSSEELPNQIPSQSSEEREEAPVTSTKKVSITLGSKRLALVS